MAIVIVTRIIMATKEDMTDQKASNKIKRKPVYLTRHRQPASTKLVKTARDKKITKRRNIMVCSENSPYVTWPAMPIKIITTEARRKVIKRLRFPSLWASNHNIAIPIVNALNSMSNCILTDEGKFKTLLNMSQRMLLISRGRMISRARGLRLALGRIIADNRIIHKTKDGIL